MDTETRTVLERIIVGMDAGFMRSDERFISLQTEMRDGFASLRTEMRDGFESVDERLTSIERDVGALWAESRAHGAAITGLSDRVSILSERVATLTERVGALEKRQDSMSNDMRQRFRTVIERLAALEHSSQ